MNHWFFSTLKWMVLAAIAAAGTIMLYSFLAEMGEKGSTSVLNKNPDSAQKIMKPAKRKSW